MEFTLVKVDLWLVFFMHSILLLKSISGDSQRMHDQNLNESK